MASLRIILRPNQQYFDIPLTVLSIHKIKKSYIEIPMDRSLNYFVEYIIGKSGLKHLTLEDTSAYWNPSFMVTYYKN